MAFARDGASVMLSRRAGVVPQLCAGFSDLFKWHCSNHRPELAVGDILTQKPERIGSVCTESGSVFLSGWLQVRELSKLFGRATECLRCTNTANDVTRDSPERAKYRGLHDVLTSVSFVVHLRVMYDA